MGLEEIRSEIEKQLTLYMKEKSKIETKFAPGENKVQYSGPVYDGEELNAMVGSILDGWFGVGKIACQFEEEFASYLGLSDAIVTNSGSSANLIAVAALKSNQFKEKLEDGDRAAVFQ